jgi:hypothetical protein
MRSSPIAPSITASMRWSMPSGERDPSREGRGGAPPQAGKAKSETNDRKDRSDESDQRGVTNIGASGFRALDMWSAARAVKSGHTPGGDATNDRIDAPCRDGGSAVAS